MTGWIAAGVLLAAAVGVLLVTRWRQARLIRRLDAMLTAAMDGTFTETSFDESRLSGPAACRPGISRPRKTRSAP